MSVVRHGLAGAAAGGVTMVLGLVLSPSSIGGEQVALVSGAVSAVVVNGSWPLGGLVAGYRRGGNWKDCVLAGAIAGFLPVFGIMVVLLSIAPLFPSQLTTDLFVMEAAEFIVFLLRFVALIVAFLGLR
ncbi:hypothetical protein BRC86_04205 [Halobacteriales archaeon QS_3_64_16]|nr:MAG: hypothetical protein BRC86_04205 [Halobacteriales archaeon QS_3_64_16]